MTTCAGALRCVTVRVTPVRYARSCVTIVRYTVDDDMLNGGALRSVTPLRYAADDDVSYAGAFNLR